MIHANAHGHDEPAVFLPVPPPVDDGWEIQIAVRQFDIHRIIGDPGNIRSVEPVGIFPVVVYVLVIVLCFFQIAKGVFIKRFVILELYGVDGRAGLCVLVKDVMAGVYNVITDKLVRFIQIIHLIVVARIEDL